MKKILILAVAAAFLMSGCNNGTNISEIPSSETTSSEASSTENSNDITSSEITIIKWGSDPIYGKEEDEVAMAGLNEQLAAEGSNIRVELVELDDNMDQDITFAKLVTDYEKENGSLDIVTYGGDWENKRGAANILIESGYFAELSEEDIGEFTDIPEVFWNSAKVGGKNYTVPGLTYGIGNKVGLYFYFNNKYIPEDKVKDFSGTFEELKELLSGITADGKFTKLEYQLDYLNFTHYTPASVKGGLYLSDKTMKAVNPYESEEVIEYARTLNSIYKAGYTNYRINFSDWEETESLGTDFAISVYPGEIDEDVLKKRLGNDYKVSVYTQPYYVENRLLGSTGIPAGSAHPNEAMELLKRLHSDEKLSAALSKKERNVIGLPQSDVTIDPEAAKLSPFADFELRYTDSEKYTELSSLCKNSFDKLCKAEDFDKTLAEIQAELKAAGIDDYVALVNKRLEENNAAANQ